MIKLHFIESAGTLRRNSEQNHFARFEYPSDKTKLHIREKILQILQISLIASNQIFVKRSTPSRVEDFMQIPLSKNKLCPRFNLSLVEGRRPLALRPSIKTLTLFIKNMASRRRDSRRRPANLFLRGWRPSLWLVSVVAIAEFRSTQASARRRGRDLALK